MNLKDLAKKFWDECKAKNLFGAMKTMAEILEKTAGTGELLFGTAGVEDLTTEFEGLSAMRAEVMKDCSCGDGSCLQAEAADGDVQATAEAKAVNPLWLALIDLAIKIIADRMKK